MESRASPPGLPTVQAKRPSLHRNDGVPFDFVSQRPVDLSDCCFVLFLKIGFAHDRRPGDTLAYGKRVQIPRCRATVSEDIATGHWGKPGKASCSNRMLGSFERKLTS